MTEATDQLGPDGERILAEAMQAFHADDAARLRDVLGRHPALRTMVNAPIGPFDSPVIIHVRSREMLDVLLDAGADINGRSRWWAGGFGVLDCASPDVASYAIERGATVDVHAAARSEHIDAVNVALADASVHSVSSTIDEKVWWALCTRHGPTSGPSLEKNVGVPQ